MTLRTFDVWQRPYTAFYDENVGAEGNHAEFVRYVKAEVRNAGQVESTIVGLIVRMAAMNYDVEADPLDVCAATEDGEALHVAEFLHAATPDDDATRDPFAEEFGKPADLATVLVITKVDGDALDVLEMRLLVRRFSEQFEGVDFVFVPADAKFATFFEGYFRPFARDGEYLIYPRSDEWPHDRKDALN